MKEKEKFILRGSRVTKCFTIISLKCILVHLDIFKKKIDFDFEQEILKVSIIQSEIKKM